MKDKNQRERSRGKGQTKRPRDRKRYDEDRSERDERNSHIDSPFENDISWYAKNPDLVRAAASIPFPYRPGRRLRFRKIYDKTTNTYTEDQFNLPGVFTLEWMPNVGFSQDTTSPISIAAKEIYAKVRAAYSGRLYADAPDFVIYLCALDGIFSYIAQLKRVYRIVSGYTPNNYVTPEMLLGCMGFDNDAIIGLQVDKTKLWGVINQLVAMTRKFHCPNVFTMFNRHYWLNDNVYMDAPSINAQFYLFLQKGFWMFEMKETPSAPGTLAGGLTTVPMPKKGSNIVDQLFEQGSELMNALAEDEDSYTISGYLMRAYEGEPTFSVDELGKDEIFNPIYSEQVLMQIENATCFTVQNWTGLWTEIHQDPATNAIISCPTFDAPVTRGTVLYPMISSRSDMPSVEEVVEATRLQTIGKIGNNIFEDFGYMEPVDENAIRYRIVAGTEIVVAFYYTDSKAGDPVSNQEIHSVVGSLVNHDEALGAISMWDWAPRFVLTNSDGSYLFWDVHNVTYFDIDQLDQINTVCLLSEFNVYAKS